MTVSSGPVNRGPGVYVLTFDSAGRPMTMNRARGKVTHWSQHAETTAVWRRAFWALARQAAIPKLRHVEFEAIPLHRDLRSPQDTMACAPSTKAAIDGIIAAMDRQPWDAKQLDDGPHRVLGVMHRPPACGVGTDGLTVVVRAMSDAELCDESADRSLLVPVGPSVVRVLVARVGKVDWRLAGIEAGRLLHAAVD